MTIKKRIYSSFSLLVVLFVANGIASFITINSNRELSENVSAIINPSLQNLEDFEDLLIASKMYTTNWVFLRSNQDDKDALRRLHNIDYPGLKTKLNLLSTRWDNRAMADSLDKIYHGFEQVLNVEKKIMSTLRKFEDYDDPVAKLQSEMLVEDEVLPRTSLLMNDLASIVSYELKVRNQKNNNLEESFAHLRLLISLLAVSIIFIGIFLSIYLTRIIIRPITNIRHIINDLGKGITRKLNHEMGHDEIGEMVRSVNSLSEKLQATATFATEIGDRKFTTFFEPLGNDDALGKALIAMRDNIKSSDEKLNDAQHIARLGSVERDMETGKTYLSDEMFNILDIDPDSFDFDFEELVNVIHPDDLEYFINTRDKYLRDHQPASYECRIITIKGIIKHIFVQSRIVKDANGKISRIVGILQDITQRKKDEEQIKLSNERYELVIKTTNDMIWDWDLVKNTIFRNENYSRIFGDDMNDINDIGKWIANVHPNDRDRVAGHINQKINDPDSAAWETEFRYYRYNKELVYLYDRGYIIRDENKKAIRMVGATSDITERKKAEAALHKSEERYRQIVETSHEGIWLMDENDRTNFVNKRLCEIVGYTAAEMIGKKMIDLVGKHETETGASILENRKEINREGIDVKFITKNGGFVWTYLATSNVLNQEGEYIGSLAMVTDITRRKQDEELLKRSQAGLEINNQQLEQKNKELEQFAYVASHDLQEPLRTITSFVKIFRQQYFGLIDTQVDKYLNYIEQASERMQVLIKDLLDFSRIGNNRDVELVDCNKVLKDVIDDLNKAIEETGAVIHSGQLPLINGFPIEIKLLFQNLATNAIKFRKPGVAPQIEISAKNNAGVWHFLFADQGIGIEQEFYERIFIIFQRLHTRAEYPGSGIGLSHCKKIVELHHGKIWVESNPGNGCTFNFTIPQEAPKNKLLI